MNQQLVPFGKYQGRAVEEMMVDTSYCEWLAAQPWFKDRYANIYNLIINYGGEPQDSPEHNELQGILLEEKFCKKLFFLVTDYNKVQNEYYKSSMDNGKSWQEEEQKNFLVRDIVLSTCEQKINISDLQFENCFDVTFAYYIYNNIIYTYETLPIPESLFRRQFRLKNQNEDGNEIKADVIFQDLENPENWIMRYGQYDYHFNETRYRNAPLAWETKTQNFSNNHYVSFGIECKPTIGDDYPSILRELQNQIKTWSRQYGQKPKHVILLYNNFSTTNMPIEKVKKIFELSGIIMVSVQEIESVIIPDHP